MAYVSLMDSQTGFMAPLGEQGLGKELAEAYNSSAPFPHIVIDDFLPPELLERVLEQCESLQANDEAVSFNRAQERFKTSYQPDSLAANVRQLFYSFNSKPFIKLMENITGIKGLIPDPYFLGAGIHEIKQGGHLSVHADFNHHKPMNLERRINVLIYLNKDWKAEYGGSLELWDQGMTNREHEIVPVFNRCVIFNTTADSQHGNPSPIDHPHGVSRKSIALYYYTSTWDNTKRPRTTQFQVRPNTNDRSDLRVKAHELFEEYLPPFLARRAKRLI